MMESDEKGQGEINKIFINKIFRDNMVKLVTESIQDEKFKKFPCWEEVLLETFDILLHKHTSVIFPILNEAITTCLAFKRTELVNKGYLDIVVNQDGVMAYVETPSGTEFFDKYRKNNEDGDSNDQQ